MMQFFRFDALNMKSVNGMPHAANGLASPYSFF